MLVTLLGIVMLVRPEQPQNAEAGMFFTFSPIVTVDNDLQPPNTGKNEYPIHVQFVALNSTLVRPEQSENALYPMLVTLLGIVILVRPEQ